MEILLGKKRKKNKEIKIQLANNKKNITKSFKKTKRKKLINKKKWFVPSV